MQVSAGPLAGLADRTAVAAGDGRAVVVRDGPQVRAFASRCPHQDLPLAGGWVRDGVLSCPHHFWRFRADDGRPVASRVGLTPLAVAVVDGEVVVDVPDEAAQPSLRQRLLERARSYDRDLAWRQHEREHHVQE